MRAEYALPAHTLERSGTEAVKIYFEEISYSKKGTTAETATLGSGIFSRYVGSHEGEVTVRGHFSPEDRGYFMKFIEGFNDEVGTLIIDGEEIKKSPVMLAGTAEIKAGCRLGEFEFRFGGD